MATTELNALATLRIVSAVVQVWQDGNGSADTHMQAIALALAAFNEMELRRSSGDAD